MYEHEIYATEKAILKANNISLPDDLGLDFAEPEYPKSAQDEIMFNQFMLDNNLISHTKLLQNYNNDLTDEQAKQIIDDNVVANNEMKRKMNEQGQSIIQRLRNRTETA